MLLGPALIAGAVACLAWWASTGAILVLVRRADRAGRHARAAWAALPMAGLGLWGFVATLDGTTQAAAYGAFFAALAVWGWIEASFLLGVITGPSPRPARTGVPEWERFLRAWGTVAYHEMTLTAALIGLALLSHGAANRVGFWTFAVLYAARVSAKLNLFLGVRKVASELIPRPLAHLPSHFREARLNWLFPASVTGLTFAVACWLERAAQAQAPADAVGFALLAALTALALLEHWLLILPLPDEKLWRWMLPKADPEERDAVR